RQFLAGGDVPERNGSGARERGHRGSNRFAVGGKGKGARNIVGYWKPLYLPAAGNLPNAQGLINPYGTQELAVAGNGELADHPLMSLERAQLVPGLWVPEMNRIILTDREQDLAVRRKG